MEKDEVAETVEEVLAFVKNVSPEEIRKMLKRASYETLAGVNPETLNLK